MNNNFVQPSTASVVKKNTQPNNNVQQSVSEDLKNNSAVCGNTDDSETGFTTVLSRNKLKKLRQEENFSNIEKSNLQLPPNITQTVGKLTGSALGTSKLKGIEKKAVVNLRKIGPCTKEVIEEHLNFFKVKFISVRPNFAKKEKLSASEIEKEESKSFRICIPESEKTKIFNPEIWPQHAVIRDWIFNTDHHQHSQTNG